MKKVLTFKKPGIKNGLYLFRAVSNLQPFAVSIVPPEDLDLFNAAEKMFQLLREIDLGLKEGRKVKVSCHMLARAFSEVLSVQYVDGYFGEVCEHSWLVTQNGLILDVYPVGIVGGPMLIDTRFAIKWNRMYEQSSLPNLSGPDFIKCTEIVAQAVRQAAAICGLKKEHCAV